MSTTKHDRRLAVRASSHARIAFDTTTPPGTELVIEHLCNGNLLARERRPLTVEVSNVKFKTHPAASHVVCTLCADGQPIDGVRFKVECGQAIEPTPRRFIVIGAMKAGTTTLFELLAQHPSLCQTWAEVPGLSFKKEINYFNHLYRKGDGALDYDWRFPFDTARHAWTLDVSPNYAKWPMSRGVPARIASLGGETKLAYLLRDPIDRIESHFAHRLRQRGNAPSMKHCIRISRYAAQLDKFMKHFEHDKILLLDFEQLRRNSAVIQQQVCDFLGIDRFIAHSVVHNRRSIKYRLPTKERADLVKALRPDVQRLITAYGFKPAEKWLRKSAFRWMALKAGRR